METKDVADATRILKSWIKSAVMDSELSTSTHVGVLVFPHVNDLAIYIIQETIKESCPSLVSFVLGSESSKRVVICKDVLLQSKILRDALKVQTGDNDVETAAKSENGDKGSQPNSSNSESFHLPEDRLSLTSDEGECGLSLTELSDVRKPKRPDKPLYVPVGKRYPKTSQRALKPETPVLEKEKNTTRIHNLKNSSSTTEAVSELPIPSHIVSMNQPSANEYWEPLDVTHLGELEQLVGSVEIFKPVQMVDYNALTLLGDPSLAHVVEVYGFSKSFETNDLHKILGSEKAQLREYNIKWINPTSALLLFRDSQSASEALTLRHPDIKLRPMCVASSAARIKAKRSPSSVLPYKERPLTVPTVARRLVTHSLGLRSSFNYAEEENILKAAREKKKLLKEEKNQGS